MAAAAHNPAFAAKVGIPVSVAKDFNQADQADTSGAGPGMGDFPKVVQKQPRGRKRVGIPTRKPKHY